MRSLLVEYVKSPSLRHIRDFNSLNKLARDIIRLFAGDRSTWRNWSGERETLLKAAMHCWISVEDLGEYLNGMPGPGLTATDVAQRLRALWEDVLEAWKVTEKSVPHSKTPPAWGVCIF